MKRAMKHKRKLRYFEGTPEGGVPKTNKAVDTTLGAAMPIVGAALAVGKTLSPMVANEDKYGVAQSGLAQSFANSLDPVGMLGKGISNLGNKDMSFVEKLAGLTPIGGFMEQSTEAAARDKMLKKAEIAKEDTGILDAAANKDEAYQGLARKGYHAYQAKASMKSGGKVTGPGTEKSDSIDTSLDPGTFIVPAENSSIAMKLGQKYLGWDKQSKAQKGGSVPVKLSNNEVMFTPEEKAILESKGISLASLAPNAEGSNKLAEGGEPIDPRVMAILNNAVKGESKDALVQAAYGEGFTAYDTVLDYAKWVKPSKPLSQMTVREVLQLQKDSINAQRKAGRGDAASGAIGKYQFVQSTLRDALKKVGAKETDLFTNDLQDRMAVNLLEGNDQKLTKWLKGEVSDAEMLDRINSEWSSIPNENNESDHKGIGNNNSDPNTTYDKELEFLKSIREGNSGASNEPKKGDTDYIDPVKLKEFQSQLAYNEKHYGDPTTFLLPQNNSNGIDRLTGLPFPLETKSSLVEETISKKARPEDLDWLDEQDKRNRSETEISIKPISPLASQITPSFDPNAKRELAGKMHEIKTPVVADAEEGSKMNIGNVLSLAQIAAGASGLALQGKRPEPTDKVDPEYEAFVNELRIAEAKGLTTEQWAAGITHANDLYKGDIYTARELSGGDAGLALIYANTASNKQRKDMMHLTELDASLMHQDRQSIRAQRGQAEAFLESRRSGINKAKDDQNMHRYDVNQAAYANLLNAGIANTVALNDPLYKKYQEQYNQ